MEYLFSYGTLGQEKTQLNLFSRKLNGTADSLKGYLLVPVEITDDNFLAKGEAKHQLNVVCSDNQKDEIKGMVLELSPDELEICDQYEPENYQRIKVELASGISAWIYLMNDEP